MKATIRDIALGARVSETTVSLAFRPSSRISDKTRRKVFLLAQKLNYLPNEAARNLRHGGSNVLAILVNDITNPFYSHMVREVEYVTQRQDYQVIVMESQWDGKKELAAVNRMLQSRVRGALICPSEKTNESFELLASHNVPCIALDSFPVGYKGSYVANDLTVAGKLAAAHILEVGCKNPAIVIPKNGRRYFSSFGRLVTGFSSIITSNDISFGPSRIFNADLTIEDGSKVLPSILNAMPKVDCILCGNDLCALGIIEAMDKMGIKVGQEIAVMGIDDLPIAQLERISLTSMKQPYEKISELAVNTIIQIIEAGKPILIRETLPPILIKRNSTKRNQAK